MGRTAQLAQECFTNSCDFRAPYEYLCGHILYGDVECGGVF